MTQTILVTGATGNVGREVIARLDPTLSIRAGVQHAPSDLPDHVAQVVLNFEDPATFDAALTGVQRVFLMRPPAISDASILRAFVEAAKAHGVQHIVFLSLLGAEKNTVVPHAAIEKAILAVGIPYTFLRPSFFMQNLTTTHRDEIRERDELLVPAGSGRTSFIDVRDIAAVAALALSADGHENQAYPLTGSEALTYDEVAAELTRVLNRPIRYVRPSLWRFWRYHRARGTKAAFIMVMIAIYTTCRLGLAATVTPDTERLLGRAPIRLRQFVEDYRTMWE